MITETRKAIIEFIEPYWYLWNYDITAILRYFKYHSYSWEFWPDIIYIWENYIEIQEIKKLCKCDIPEVVKIIWKFPNKPPHLYTDKEDEELFEFIKNYKYRNKKTK